MSSEHHTTAWAIAVSTIPILKDLHGENRDWKKGESPVPEYLYFDVLLRAQEDDTENPTIHQVAYQIKRRVEWILQQRNEKAPGVSEILSHLCSPQFFDWMAKCFWDGKDEVDDEISFGCAPIHCHGLQDRADWMEQCPQKPPCIDRSVGDYCSYGFYNCDWCGWHNSQICLKCFDRLVNEHPTLPESLQDEVQWIHELIIQGETNLVLYLPELSKRAILGHQKFCEQGDRLFIMKYGHHPQLPLSKTIDVTRLKFPEKYKCQPSCCPVSSKT